MSNPWWVAVPVAVAALGLAGCGGTSQEELDAAREQGAAQASASAEAQRLQEQIDELKQQNAQNKSAAKAAQRRAARAERAAARNRSSGGGNSGGTTTGGLSGPVTDCGDGVFAGANTSCAFAVNVWGEWGGSPRSSVRAYSPTTGQYYQMTCSPYGSQTVCVGGNNASVYF